MRRVLVLESDSARVFADGGWGAAGAVTVADESLVLGIFERSDSVRRAGNASEYGAPPSVGFSGVVQVYLPHEEVHFAHRPPGLTTRDVVVHFEVGHVVMLGNLVSTGEYPDVGEAGRQGLDSLLASLDWFTDSLPREAVEPLVPGRGRPLTVSELREHRAMLSTVFGRVRAAKAAGRSEDEVVASRPAAEFDATWGRGRVSSDAFVRGVYQALGRD